VAARADGHGWLLGDDGSAVWLGREAARAALSALDGRGPATALTRLVPEALDVAAAGRGPDAVARSIIAAADALPPEGLGRLAPLVSRAAEGGDAVASALAQHAARLLLRTLRATYRGGPVVLAGGVLVSRGPVAEAVRAGVRERFGTEPSLARDGAGGAAALAVRRVRGDALPWQVHTRLTGRR